MHTKPSLFRIFANAAVALCCTVVLFVDACVVVSPPTNDSGAQGDTLALESAHTYTLVNCSNVISLSSSAGLENVTVVIIGGWVLPQIAMASRNRNVSVVVDGRGSIAKASGAFIRVLYGTLRDVHVSISNLSIHFHAQEGLSFIQYSVDVIDQMTVRLQHVALYTNLSSLLALSATELQDITIDWGNVNVEQTALYLPNWRGQTNIMSIASLLNGGVNVVTNNVSVQLQMCSVLVRCIARCKDVPVLHKANDDYVLVAVDLKSSHNDAISFIAKSLQVDIAFLDGSWPITEFPWDVDRGMIGTGSLVHMITVFLRFKLNPDVNPTTSHAAALLPSPPHVNASIWISNLSVTANVPRLALVHASSDEDSLYPLFVMELTITTTRVIGSSLEMIAPGERTRGGAVVRMDNIPPSLLFARLDVFDTNVSWVGTLRNRSNAVICGDLLQTGFTILFSENAVMLRWQIVIRRSAVSISSDTGTTEFSDSSVIYRFGASIVDLSVSSLDSSNISITACALNMSSTIDATIPALAQSVFGSQDISAVTSRNASLRNCVLHVAAFRMDNVLENIVCSRSVIDFGNLTLQFVGTLDLSTVAAVTHSTVHLEQVVVGAVRQHGGMHRVMTQLWMPLTVNRSTITLAALRSLDDPFSLLLFRASMIDFLPYPTSLVVNSSIRLNGVPAEEGGGYGALIVCIDPKVATFSSQSSIVVQHVHRTLLPKPVNVVRSGFLTGDLRFEDSRVVMSGCNLSTAHAQGSTVFALTSTPSPSVVWLELFCNLWNNWPLECSDVVGLPDGNVLYHSGSTFPATGGLPLVVCPGVCRRTRSATISVSDTLLGHRGGAEEEEEVLTQASNGVSGAAAAVAGFAAASGAMAVFDMQAIASMGLSSCAPELAKSSSPSRFLVSPFFSFGPAAIAFGNLGLVLLAFALHYVLVKVKAHLLVRERRTQLQSISHHENPFHDYLAEDSCYSHATQLLRFPNASLQFGSIWIPGICFGCSSLFGQGSVLAFFLGTSSVVVMMVVVWVRSVHLGYGREAKKFQFHFYTLKELHHAQVGPFMRCVPLVAAPVGRWGPPNIAATHGRMRSAVTVGRESYSEYAAVFSCAISAIAGVPINGVACGLLFGVASVIPATMLVIMLWKRPCRVPFANYINSVQYGLSFAAMLGTAIARGADEQTSAGAGSLLEIVALLVALVSIVKVGHSAIVMLWERRLRHAAAHLLEEAHDRCSAALRRRGKTGADERRRSAEARTRQQLLLPTRGSIFPKSLAYRANDMPTTSSHAALTKLVEMCCARRISE